MKSIKIIAVAAALTLAGQAFATDWYVSPSGKNKNEGTSPSAPLKNIWQSNLPLRAMSFTWLRVTTTAR